MRYFDLHVHTDFCDGAATAEEMVRAALELGCPKLGFSAHAPMPIGGYAMPAEREDEYRAEIFRLREKYRDKIEILCGLEVDTLCYPVTRQYDYIIGACHWLPLGQGRYAEVDGPCELLAAAIRDEFGGDPYAAVERYYRAAAGIAALRPDIVGHFDLIRKHNAGSRLFDEEHPRYLAAAYAAIDALLPLGIPFEVNTGGVCRGYRDTPYPAAPLLSYLFSKGGRVILTGDAHRPENLCYEFDKWAAYLRTLRV